MENQLHLRISTGGATAPDWHLDDSTRAVGRSGVALARAALEQARRTRVAEGTRAEQPSEDHTTAA